MQSRVAAALISAIVLGASIASAEPEKCARAIAKEARKLGQARSKALVRCELLKVKGRGDKLDPPAADCAADMTTAAKLAKASSTFAAKVAKACGGDDKVCGGDLSGEDLPATLGFPAECPSLGTAACTGALADCGDVATCVACLVGAAVDRAVALPFDDLVPSDPKDESRRNKCQQTIGKEQQKFLAVNAKALLGCWDARLKGKHAGACPDATAAAATAPAKAAAKVAKAESKLTTKICKACGGKDGDCDEPVAPVNPLVPVLGGTAGSGEAADLEAGAIWSRLACPAVTVPAAPGRPVRSCGGAVATLADLATCVACVTEFQVDCAVPASVPGLVAYPEECRAVPPLRPGAPVVVTGADLGLFVAGASPAAGSASPGEIDPRTATSAHALAAGMAPEDLVAFRFTATSGWEQIPVQVDERAVISFDAVYNGEDQGPWCCGPGSSCTVMGGGCGGGFTRLDYTDAGTFTGADPDPALDDDDEIVFMEDDAGDRPDTFAAPTGTVTGSGVEVAITDPALPGVARYVYLFEQSGGLDPSAGEQYVAYDFDLLSGDYKTTYVTGDPVFVPGNPEDTTLVTDVYATRFADRWTRDELQILAGNASGIDLLDRHSVGFSPTSCVRTEDTFDHDEGAFIINKSGPVRAIRSYLGANSGPLTQRQHLFYREREEVTTFLRVHTLFGIADFFDYAPAAIGMTYRSEAEPAGLAIDGVPDAPLVRAPVDWELVSGAPGSLVMVHELDTDVPGLNVVSFFRDDQTGFSCTGDNVPIGASGPWVDDCIPNTDPTERVDAGPCPNDPGVPSVLTSRRTIFYGTPGLTVQHAEARRAEVMTPLVRSTSSFGAPLCPGRVAFTITPGGGSTGLDLGWTGSGHALPLVSGWQVTAASVCSEVPTPASPSCGACALTGPIVNDDVASGGFDGQRCTNATSVVCGSDAACFAQCVGGLMDGQACTPDACVSGPVAGAPCDTSADCGRCVGGTNAGAACTSALACESGVCDAGTCDTECDVGGCVAAGTCAFFPGPPVPAVADGLPGCLEARFVAALTGTFDPTTGAAAAQWSTEWRIFNGVELERPCPTCDGDLTANDGVADGTCVSGARNGLACDVSGLSPIAAFGATSPDCPPSTSGLQGAIPVALQMATATGSMTLSGDSPLCTPLAPSGPRCFCSTCNDAAGAPCRSDAECPASPPGTPGVCGGGRCSSGPKTGAPCVVAGDCRVCVGGPHDGTPCSVGLDCGECTGPNAGAACSSSAQCAAPGTCVGRCEGACAFPLAGPNACNDGVCTEAAGGAGECLAGPVAARCAPAEPFRPCVADSDCVATGDSCVPTPRACFPGDGSFGDTLVAPALVEAAGADTWQADLAAIGCTAAIAGSPASANLGLPSPVRLTLSGTLQALP